MIVVTGGLGFLGSALVRELAVRKRAVTVLDDGSRGATRRLVGVKHRFDECDVTKPFDLPKGAISLFHLAAVNGTINFYKEPWRVLEVQLRGTINALDACRRAGVKDFVLYSSSEAYQTPPKIPTPEDVPLVVPDPANPRYSYGGGKIAAELMVRHCPWLERVIILRPHNVYGPDMGHEHVVPEFTRRMCRLPRSSPGAIPPEFQINGEGAATRAFCHVRDATAGALLAWEKAPKGRWTYNLGTQDMVTISDLAGRVARLLGKQPRWRQAAGAQGGTRKRCPDITKLRSLGYEPKVPLDDGLAETVSWYLEHQDEWPT